jgi:protocatechuate 3,4-dioxygenase beta subunit
MLRITLSIAVTTLLALSLYLLIALPLLKEPDTDTRSTPATAADNDGREIVVDTDNITAEAIANTTPIDSGIRDSSSRLIEIYGQITDSQGQPIEDALVTEERYFFATRSDIDGRYRIRVDLPRHRLPEMNFLRAGYSAQRVKLTQEQLQHNPVYPLDVVLADSAETLRLSGWVANDLGIGLEGARVEISALEPETDKDYYLTVFSDERGNFVLEGVRSVTRYKLTATLAPEYPVYRNPDFYVGSDAEQLNIVLKSLKFVKLAGMILNPEAAPVANFEIYIKNVTTGVHSRKIVSDSSGFFSLEQFPLGEISLSTRGAEFHKISGIVLTEQNYSNLVLLVDRGDRYLSGWVSDENGVALQKAMVTLDTTFGDGRVEYFSYRSQTTDNSGWFSFENVAVGDHRISAYANGFNKLEASHSLHNQSDQIHIRMTRHD